MTVRRCVLVLIVVAGARSDPVWAIQYRSDAYELAADLPDSWTVCLDGAPAANHGFVVRLEPGECDGRHQGAEVTFAVSYNAAFEYPSTPAMRGTVCGSAAARWSGLHVAGARMMRCAPQDEPGWARVVHFGLRARRGDEGLASTEVVVTARCPRRRMVECLAVVTGIGARMRGWARGGP